MKVILETHRLILREYTMEDFDELYAILSDPETMRHYPAPYDEKGVARWLTWSLNNYKTCGFGLWAIQLKENGQFIGDCGITMQSIDGESLPEIGYHIHKDQWRKGYAKEAATAVRDWFFTHTDYAAVYSYMKYTNLPSYATAASLGMRRVKEYPDPKDGICYVYRITRKEWKKRTFRTLQTQRLLLRPWREEDAETLYQYAKEPEVGIPAGWMPHTSPEHSREILRTVLRKPTVFAVCLKDGTPMGNIHLNFETDMSDREDECELGYWLGKPFWGQGIIPEAARELLRYAFEELGVNAVWCGRYDGNEKSRRVQEKLGFVYHHTTHGLEVPDGLRTGHVMLMTRETWETIYRKETI